ncbi:hypothetical protein ACHAXR_010935 [Thalassiosira sp. AJA248-18]
MGIKNPRVHGDPLLMEVVAGLEDTLASIHIQEGKNLGSRGVGERTFCKGDSLLREAERYHHAEHDRHEASQLALHLKRVKHNSLFDHRNALFDPILEEYVLPKQTLIQLKVLERDIADGGIAPREDLLKRHKNNSLFSSHSGAMFDPVLQEYILPSTTMLELKALKEDMIKKRHLFNEMNMRREHNLQSYELFCDPLVHSSRMRELIFKGSSPSSPKRAADKIAPSEAVLSEYRKLNAGDDLFNATM